jgi:hypothetical protein
MQTFEKGARGEVDLGSHSELKIYNTQATPLFVKSNSPRGSRYFNDADHRFQISGNKRREDHLGLACFSLGSDSAKGIFGAAGLMESE